MCLSLKSSEKNGNRNFIVNKKNQEAFIPDISLPTAHLSVV